jgi:hypothetical protein
MAIEKKSLISNGSKARLTKNTVKAAAPAAKLRTAINVTTAVHLAKASVGTPLQTTVKFVG